MVNIDLERGLMASTSERPRRQFWMAVESLHNWQADKVNSFNFTGLASSREARASHVKKGDLVFIYASSAYCAFADIRIAQKDGVGRSAHSREYDLPCS